MESLDQRLALVTAAARLAEEFTGIYGPETIGRFLESSFDQFADRAAVEAMAERGIDIAAEFPKPWTDEVVRAADVVVSTHPHEHNRQPHHDHPSVETRSSP